MLEGLSTNRRCDAVGDGLVAAGKQFVIRYHSTTTAQASKRIGPAEAASLARAGLWIATVYQDRARQLDDFGFDRGVQDGVAAFTFAAQIGQPADSAIYFAVDVDFSESEIRSVVLPYFKGVRQAMAQAAGSGSVHAVGVYGSGLTCRLVRDAGLATFTWLSESTGFRESTTFTTWDVRQHRNDGETLPGLDNGFERCEARDDFGQFKPVGFDTRAAEGTPMRVTASQLNLRDAPSVTSNPPRTVLVEGQRVAALAPAADGWIRVRVTIQGAPVIGYASARFLAAVDAATTAPAAAPAASAAVTAQPIPAVHYRENDPESRRSSIARRAQPLGEAPRPRRDAIDAAGRTTQIAEIIRWLAVDRSLRYQRDTVTYCNVHAADFCYLAGVYLPRTWWTGSALMAIARGERPAALYGTTIREMRADDLYAWLTEFGPVFGWRPVFDLTALQSAANAGGVGLICADRDAEGKPGHITVVVPEIAGQKARRDVDGHVVLPLQSQAGATNFQYGDGGRAWWAGAEFKARGFFVHD